MNFFHLSYMLFKIISPTITSCRYIFIYKSWFIVWFFLLKRCSFFLILFAIISIFLILFRILSSRRSRFLGLNSLFSEPVLVDDSSLISVVFISLFFLKFLLYLSLPFFTFVCIWLYKDELTSWGLKLSFNSNSS